MRLERTGLLPFGVPAGFDLLGVVGLVEHCEPYNEKRPLNKKATAGAVALDLVAAPGVSGGSAGRSRVRRTARPWAAGSCRAIPSASAAASLSPAPQASCRRPWSGPDRAPSGRAR